MKSPSEQPESSDKPKEQGTLRTDDLLGIWLLKTKPGDIIEWKHGGLSKVCPVDEINNADWKIADPEKPWVMAHVIFDKPHHLWIQTEDETGDQKSIRHDEVASWWAKMPNGPDQR